MLPKILIYEVWSWNFKNGELPIKDASDADLSILVAARENPNKTLIWNTTWGGAGADVGRDLAVDGAENVYITGKANSFSGVYNAFTAIHVLRSRISHPLSL